MLPDGRLMWWRLKRGFWYMLIPKRRYQFVDANLFTLVSLWAFPEVLFSLKVFVFIFLLKANRADMVTLDAGEVYSAVKQFGLVTIAKEIYSDGGFTSDSWGALGSRTSVQNR